MKIYTRTGDKGKTSLLGGERVDKDDLQVEAYGTVDEANACIGLAVALLPAEGLFPLCDKVRNGLACIQLELFDVGAVLATPANRTTAVRVQVGMDRVQAMERKIDELEATLEPLHSFIVPGGLPPSAALHLARTVSRRAERQLVALSRRIEVDPVVLQYMNRLSDYLFTCARAVNQALSARTQQ